MRKNFKVDVDNENSNYNYKYDEVGELIKDSIEGLDVITWTITGKVKEIDKTSGDKIFYDYDPMGNRISEDVFTFATSTDVVTYYSRDATGNIMATYTKEKDGSVRVNDMILYGASRLGRYKMGFLTYNASPVTYGVYALSGTITSTALSGAKQSFGKSNDIIGNREYELTNHLGNVLATVTSGKDAILGTGGTTFIVGFKAHVLTEQDYYSFGMLQPNRQFVDAGGMTYKFGYQGSLKDNDVSGEGNNYSTLYRGLDPRTARWWSVDPETNKTPWEGPYVSMADKPIWHNDILGNVVEGGPGPATPFDINTAMSIYFYKPLSNAIQGAANWIGNLGQAAGVGAQEVLLHSKAVVMKKDTMLQLKHNIILVLPRQFLMQETVEANLCQ